jgi:DNA-binding NtrC family response regulator
VGKRILVIDDESMILNAIKLIIGDLGHEVNTFSTPEDGEAEALRNDYDLILTDLRMPGKNGAEITEAILKAKPDARILMITAFPNDELAIRAMKAGALGLLKKPFEISKIIEYLGE